MLHCMSDIASVADSRFPEFISSSISSSVAYRFLNIDFKTGGREAFLSSTASARSSRSQFDEPPVFLLLVKKSSAAPATMHILEQIHLSAPMPSGDR